LLMPFFFSLFSSFPALCTHLCRSHSTAFALNIQYLSNMQFGVGCDCEPLEDVGVAWLEATTTYGIDGPGHPWTNNTVSETSVKRECGRIYGSLENSERQSHVFGEIKACTEAAFAAEAKKKKKEKTK